MTTPTTSQILALQQFATLHGRTWKSMLRRRWERGDWMSDEPSCELQQVRNAFGPSWLTRFRFPADCQPGRAPAEAHFLY